MKKSQVKSYYDDYITNQYYIGVNDRIFLLFEKLKSLGLNSNSKVVELGCGIGVVTHLIRKIVTKGSIEAVDISPKSIEFAKSKIPNSNVIFEVDDVTEYTPTTKNADFVTLFDVIEHIPTEHHLKLFKNVNKMLSKNGQCLINIPSPSSIEWDRIHQPEALQIIDQALPLSLIASNCEQAGLEITKFETYSIWKENDYQFFLLQPKTEYRNEPVQLNFFKKVKRKLWRLKFENLFKY